VAAIRVGDAVPLVFVLLTITFVLLTIGAYWLPAAVTAVSGWTKAAG
jgi:succinate-acetate transporter protein